jgi:hypothetical protein
MPKQYISLSSISLDEEKETKYVLIGDVPLTFEMVFTFDCDVRKVLLTKSDADWEDISKSLVWLGYTFVDAPEDGASIFEHPRCWDEHLFKNAMSFFVALPKTADPEIADQFFLATSYPAFHGPIKQEELGRSSLFLINKNGRIIRPEDLEIDGQQTEVILVESQFPNGEQVESACSYLIFSGYKTQTLG